MANSPFPRPARSESSDDDLAGSSLESAWRMACAWERPPLRFGERDGQKIRIYECEVCHDCYDNEKDMWFGRCKKCFDEKASL